MLTTQRITKDEGMGPYLYVLQYRAPQSIELLSSRVSQSEGDTMVCVFSTWNDMHNHRETLERNGIVTTWDIAIDRMARAS